MVYRNLLLFVASLIITTGCQRADPLQADSSAERSAKAPVKLAGDGDPAIELIIDFGDGVAKRFTRIPYEEGITVLDALEFAARHPRGISFEKSGSGSSALLTQIDDLDNQSGQSGKNWLYRVNGKLADKSFDAYVLAPGDVILWKFEEYE